MLAERGQRITRSSSVGDRGQAITFQVKRDGSTQSAFLIREKSVAKAYLNVCAHVGLPLDKRKSDFWHVDGVHIACKHHGALYEPASGLCVRGPCQGFSLIPLPVFEADGWVRLVDAEYDLVTSAEVTP